MDRHACGPIDETRGITQSDKTMAITAAICTMIITMLEQQRDGSNGKGERILIFSYIPFFSLIFLHLFLHNSAAARWTQFGRVALEPESQINKRYEWPPQARF